MKNQLRINSKHIHLIVAVELLKLKIKRLVLCLVVIFAGALNIQAEKVYIGVANVDITPDLPVALGGQFNLRIAETAETPLSASVVVLESQKSDQSIESVVFVSCDLVSIPTGILEGVRNEVHKLLPELDVKKIILNATHTHTGPVVKRGVYPIPENGVTQVEAYYAFFIKRVSAGIYEAWNNRSLGSITWGLGHAKVAYNRRVVYADNSAKMYGSANLPEFRNIEGYEDQNINTLFFWNQVGELIAVSIDVACPAQQGEDGLAINADYWHPVRVSLRKRFGSKLCVLGWIGAAGDVTSHRIYGMAGEGRMCNLRKLNRVDEIARRIVSAVEDTYEVVKKDRFKNIKFIHKVENVSLPTRVVLESEYISCKKEIERLKAQIHNDPKAKDLIYRRLKWEEDVIKRYEQQKINSQVMYNTEVHVIRIGDIVICTNPFELFTDYGIAIQARSNTVQTFIVQLAGAGRGSYLPTERAVKGGHYSAIVQSNIVGPEGGQVLVNSTVKLIHELFWIPEYK